MPALVNRENVQEPTASSERHQRTINGGWLQPLTPRDRAGRFSILRAQRRIVFHLGTIHSAASRIEERSLSRVRSRRGFARPSKRCGPLPAIRYRTVALGSR